MKSGAQHPAYRKYTSAQEVRGIVASIGLGVNHFVLSVASDKNDLRVEIPIALSSDIDIGECWHFHGRWASDRNSGEYLIGVTAGKVLPNEGELSDWLRLNVVGLNSWHIRMLHSHFGAQIPSLLENRAYEVLQSAGRRSSPIPLLGLINACASWCNYIDDVATRGAITNEALRLYCRPLRMLYGRNTAKQINSNPYLLAEFVGFEVIERVLSTNGSLSLTSEERIDAAIFDIAWAHLTSNCSQIAYDSLCQKLAPKLKLAPSDIASAIDKRVKAGTLYKGPFGFIQTERIALIERAVAKLLLTRENSLQCHDEQFVDGRRLYQIFRKYSERSSLQILVHQPQVESGFILFQEKIFDSYIENGWVIISRHAQALRNGCPQLAKSIYQAGQVRQSWPPSTSFALILEAHTYTIAEWAQLLISLQTVNHIWLMGTNNDATAAFASFVSCSRFPIFNLDVELQLANSHSLSNWRTSGINQYCPSTRGSGLVYAHTPSDQIVKAAAGIYYQATLHGSAAIVSCEPDLCDQLNCLVQTQMLDVNRDSLRASTIPKLFVGDYAIQTAVWPDSAPIMKVAKITAVHQNPILAEDPFGNFRWIHVEIEVAGLTYYLSRLQASTLVVSYAVHDTSFLAEAVDTLIVASRTAEISSALIGRYIARASVSVVFVAPAPITISWEVPDATPPFDRSELERQLSIGDKP